MPRWNDPTYLRTQQYKTPSNLQARMALHQRFSTNPHGWVPWVWEHLQLAPGSRILEIGCGPGTLWQQNRARIPGDWRVTLCDMSPGMVRQARENLGDTPAIACGTADTQHLPFAGASFHAVIANHMLYHVPDRQRAIDEIWRVLRPGGRLYAATNGPGHMRELFELIDRFAPQAREKAVLGFNLENGAAQLGPFDEVVLHRYPDALDVTEAAPLVDYILSMGSWTPGQEARPALTRFVQAEMARTGRISIHKETGLFEAIKAPTAANEGK